MGRPKPSVAETSYSPSSLPASHIIVQLGPPRGSSQFTCTDPSNTERLVELNPKLKRSGMLARRGDFGVVNLYAEDPDPKAGKGKGVEGEVVCVWTEREIKGFKRGGEWPNGFGEAPPSPPALASEDEASDVSEEYGSEQEEGDGQKLQEGNDKAEESTKA